MTVNGEAGMMPDKAPTISLVKTASTVTEGDSSSSTMVTPMVLAVDQNFAVQGTDFESKEEVFDEAGHEVELEQVMEVLGVEDDFLLSAAEDEQQPTIEQEEDPPIQATGARSESPAFSLQKNSSASVTRMRSELSVLTEAMPRAASPALAMQMPTSSVTRLGSDLSAVSQAKNVSSQQETRPESPQSSVADNKTTTPPQRKNSGLKYKMKSLFGSSGKSPKTSRILNAEVDNLPETVEAALPVVSGNERPKSPMAESKSVSESPKTPTVKTEAIPTPIQPSSPISVTSSRADASSTDDASKHMDHRLSVNECKSDSFDLATKSITDSVTNIEADVMEEKSQVSMSVPASGNTFILQGIQNQSHGEYDEAGHEIELEKLFEDLGVQECSFAASENERRTDLSTTERGAGEDDVLTTGLRPVSPTLSMQNSTPSVTRTRSNASTSPEAKSIHLAAEVRLKSPEVQVDTSAALSPELGTPRQKKSSGLRSKIMKSLVSSFHSPASTPRRTDESADQSPPVADETKSFVFELSDETGEFETIGVTSGGNQVVLESERFVPDEKSIDSDKEDDEPLEPHFEFRRVNVTIQVKSLSGVIQTKPRKKDGSHGDEEGHNVTAVVTYRRNTIASDKFVSTNVPSLPLMVNESKDRKYAQVHAKWPSKVERDDDGTASVSTAGALSNQFNPSCLSLSRTVRRVTFPGQPSGDSEGEPLNSSENYSKANEIQAGRLDNHCKNEHKNFLSVMSQAFAAELVDLQVGLMRGSNEIIPIGIASVVVPGEYQTISLDIPVVRDYSGSAFGEKKKSSSFLSSLSASPSKDYASFSGDKDIKYRITEGAFLRLELKIEPVAPLTRNPSPNPNSRDMIMNTRKTDFKAGPINKAIRRRRKIERLLNLDRMSLHDRLFLYFELRKTPESSYDLPDAPNNGTDDTTYDVENSDVVLGVQCDTSLLSNGSMQDPSQGCAQVYRKSASEAKSGLAPLSDLLSSNDDRSNAPELSDDDAFSSSLYSVLSTNHPQRQSAVEMMKRLFTCDPSLLLGEQEIDKLKYHSNDHDSYAREENYSVCYSSSSSYSSYRDRRCRR